MGDQDHRHAEISAQIGQKLHDLRLNRHVQRGGGLVRDQQARAAQQRHRDHHPLPHPAREFVRIKPHPPLGIGDADGVQHPHGLGHGFAFRQALVQDQHLGHLVRDPHIGIQRGHRVLEDHRDLFGPDAVDDLGRRVQDFLPVKAHAARGAAIARQKSHDREGQLRLAAARFAHDAKRLALFQRQVHVLDGAHDAVMGLKADRQAGDVQQGHLSAPSGQGRPAGRRPRRRTRTG